MLCVCRVVLGRLAECCHLLRLPPIVSRPAFVASSPLFFDHRRKGGTIPESCLPVGACVFCVYVALWKPLGLTGQTAVLHLPPHFFAALWSLRHFRIRLNRPAGTRATVLDVVRLHSLHSCALSTLWEVRDPGFLWFLIPSVSRRTWTSRL